MPDYRFMSPEDIELPTGELLAFEREAIPDEILNRIRALELPVKLVELGAWSDGTEVWCIYCQARFLGHRLALGNVNCCDHPVPILADHNGAFPLRYLHLVLHKEEE